MTPLTWVQTKKWKFGGLAFHQNGGAEDVDNENPARANFSYYVVFTCVRTRCGQINESYCSSIPQLGSHGVLFQGRS